MPEHLLNSCLPLANCCIVSLQVAESEVHWAVRDFWSIGKADASAGPVLVVVGAVVVPLTGKIVAASLDPLTTESMFESLVEPE